MQMSKIFVHYLTLLYDDYRCWEGKLKQLGDQAHKKDRTVICFLKMATIEYTYICIFAI